MDMLTDPLHQRKIQTIGESRFFIPLRKTEADFMFDHWISIILITRNHNYSLCALLMKCLVSHGWGSLESKVLTLHVTMNVLLDVSDGNYKIHRDSKYDPYILTISDVQYTDRGFYYCCLPSNCSDDVDECQKFILRVRGKNLFLVVWWCVM